MWQGGRLEYRNGVSERDGIDRANARLASSTLERQLQLLIVLPDPLHHRAPLLFGSALVSQWWDRKSMGLPAGKVLYCGTTIGVREHLSRVRVGTLTLSDVFPQSKTNPGLEATRRRRANVASDDSSLPEVVCAYSPSDPEAVLDAYRPSWIAIDCGNEQDIRWLPQLLRHARTRNIPVIAWTHNPFSQVTRHFEATGGGKVIRWPFALPGDSGPVIEPIVIEASDSRFLRSLQDSYRFLAKATAESSGGRLESDALSVAWRIQRQLEQLTVPLDLFESESNHYWGIQSIRRLFAGVQRFISELSAGGGTLGQHLSDALSLQDQAMDAIHDSSPPLWEVLSQLCIEDTSTDQDRMIVFSSKARKQMFSLALLSRLNISEDDLSELRVSLSSLAEMKSKPIAHPSAYPRPSALLACLPSTRLSANMVPLMFATKLDILVLPFQSRALAAWVDGLNASLVSSPTIAKAVIEARSGHVSIPAAGEQSDPLTLHSGRRFAPSAGHSEAFKGKTSPLPPLDALSEIRWYMDDYEEQASDHNGWMSQPPDQQEEVWIRNAIEVRVSGGWHGLFVEENRLNVVLEGGSGRRTEERFVRSLRTGDRILVIHGQKRQSLYDLMISRVHNHPAMEIHLALINKWQEELAESFRRRRLLGWTAEDVLIRMQQQGSSITSTQTIRLWVTGEVLAPEDPKDLPRLARSMDLRFVQEYHARINRAARRIRGLHRGLSTRLNGWLREQVASTTDADLEIFDAELGLSFQDFRDSMTVHTVESVEEVSGLFLRDSLGTFEREVLEA